ncbi:MAG: chemotaxis protein CheW [Verrucomicrobiae bacterium]|nr:chemotaxis protein CheW [Verrucomicrobiae bacterium]
MSSQQPYCTFYLGPYLFGVGVGEVQEIIRHQPITRVPLSHPVFSGLINLRGAIVTTIDLRRRFELEDRPAGALPMNVIVRYGEMPVSLLVDRIGDVVEAGAETFEPPPDTLTGEARALIRGTYKLRESLLLVLDINKTCGLGAAVGV